MRRRSDKPSRLDLKLVVDNDIKLVAVNDEPAPVGCRTDSGAARVANGKTVLVVEDNDMNLWLFHDVLEHGGYQVLVARNGAQALRMARKHRPDLILMEMQLPEVSGLTVTKWIKADDELGWIPVIAITALAAADDAERVLAGGCDAYLAKPVGVARLLATVAEYID